MTPITAALIGLVPIIIKEIFSEREARQKEESES